MDPAVAQFLDLLKSHSWVALSALVIGLLVRLMRDDSAVAWFPVTIPARWRPLIALGLGMISGGLNAAASAAGLVTKTDWATALLGGAVAAFAAMSGHAIVINAFRNGRELGEPKAEAKAPGSGTPGSAAAGTVTALLLVSFLAFGTVGCASTATLIAVAQAVAIAAPYAAQVIADVEAFMQSYFAAHPDPAKLASITAALDKAKAAAQALGKLSEAGVDVSEKDYMAAMSAFAQAYADLYAVVGSLPGVALQAPGAAPLKAAPGVMVLVAPHPSAFAPKGAAR